MSLSGFRPDQHITDQLKNKNFTLSAEVIPPRNGAFQGLLADLKTMVDSGVDFLSVTKGAGGSLRGGSLPIAQIIKEQFNVPCIAHFTCRDIAPEEVENQLVDHHYFGIRNILALRGDPPQGQEWKSHAHAYDHAYQLIEQIRKLNSGEYLERKNFKVKAREPTNFCIGAAVYPDHPNPQERIDFFQRKVDAGAEYAITQMVFCEESFENFQNLCAQRNITTPLLVGTRIVKTQEQALKMAKRFEVNLSQRYLKSLPTENDPYDAERVLESFLKFVSRIKEAGAKGLHIFVLSDFELSSLGIKEMKAAW